MDTKRVLEELEESKSKIRKLEDASKRQDEELRRKHQDLIEKDLEIVNLRRELEQSRPFKEAASDSAIRNFFRSLAAIEDDGNFLKLPRGVFWMGRKLLGSSMLIRNCYIKLMDLVLETQRAAAQQQRTRTMFIVTGTPGIGKSFFSFYWLYRRMKEKKPVLFEYQDQCFYWSPNGRLIVSERGTFASLLTLTDMLYLSDSRKDIRVPTNCLTILFSSPQSKNFHDFLKNGAELCFMPLWDAEELEKARAEIYGDELPQARVDAVVAVYDFVPRYALCRAFVFQRFANWSKEDAECGDVTLGREEYALQEAIRRTNVEEYFKFKMYEGPSDEGKFSYQIQHIDTENFVDPVHKWASHYLFRSIMKIHSNTIVDSVLSTFRMADQMPNLGVFAGTTLELLVHDVLPFGCKEYKISRLTKRSDGISGPSREPQLSPKKSSFYRFLDLNEIPEVRSGVYYKPKSRNQVSFDSFMVVNNDLLIFQITFALKHPVKLEGLEKLLRKARNGERNGCVYLIFVVPVNHLQSFTEQPYHTPEGKAARELTADIRSIKQYAVAIEESEIRNRYNEKVAC